MDRSTTCAERRRDETRAHCASKRVWPIGMRADPRKSVERLATGEATTVVREATNSTPSVGEALTMLHVPVPLPESAVAGAVNSVPAVDGAAWLIRILSRALGAPPRIASALSVRTLSEPPARPAEDAQPPTWVATNASVGVTTVAA
jgi:hypothetical protein